MRCLWWEIDVCKEERFVNRKWICAIFHIWMLAVITMNKREFELKHISHEFSIWEVKLRNLSSMSLYDAHHLSEDSICDLLNAIFNFKLKNLNSLNMNFPAIDLGDKFNSVCVQVTSTKATKKIQETINKFLENKLNSTYDELFVIILGKKQKRYTALKVPDTFTFNPESHILDFEDLLRQIKTYSVSRLETISEILTNENHSQKSKKSISNSTRLKNNLALKKSLQKDFLLKLSREHWERSWYEPWIKFKYRNALIRSVDDKKWPEVDEDPSTGISSWFKGEFWDFYDNGIELISQGGRIIFDKEGCWDILNWENDDREHNQNYQTVNYHDYLRIPYDYIVQYDMETDPYYGIPSIYVEYAKDGMPYEDIVQGIGGSYDLKQMRHLLDRQKRRKLK
jgi:hypothetical protein